MERREQINWTKSTENAFSFTNCSIYWKQMAINGYWTGGYDYNDHHLESGHLDSTSKFLNSKWVMWYINLCWNVPRNPMANIILALLLCWLVFWTLFRCRTLPYKIKWFNNKHIYYILFLLLRAFALSCYLAICINNWDLSSVQIIHFKFWIRFRERSKSALELR